MIMQNPNAEQGTYPHFGLQMLLQAVCVAPSQLLLNYGSGFWTPGELLGTHVEGVIGIEDEGEEETDV